ncbi:hypothetical protein TNCV_3708531 [Trichonephila clavipes]|nr:hypothetical protein TNCV_3708531 [Trichonephila clavipes]
MHPLLENINLFDISSLTEENVKNILTEARVLSEKTSPPMCLICRNETSANRDSSRKLGWKWICKKKYQLKCSGKEDYEERGSKDRAAITCGPHSDSFNDTAHVGVAIVPQTISRHLAEADLKSKRPFRALPLTPEHRQLRLQWCQARSMWNVTDWQKIVFSDESRFVWGKDDNRVRMWRRPGERSPHTGLRHTARTADVMVWGP